MDLLFNEQQKGLLRTLDDDTAFLDKFRGALRLYDAISKAFASHVGPNINAAKKWRPVTLTAGPAVELPRFSNEQLAKFQLLPAPKGARNK